MAPQMPAHKALLAPELCLRFGRYGSALPPLVVRDLRRRKFLHRRRELLFQQISILFQLGTGLFNVRATLFHGLENTGNCEPGYGFAAANPLPLRGLVQLPKILVKTQLHLVQRQQTAFQPFHSGALRLQKAVSVQRYRPR
ncbi:MAG: hypothetical protein KGO48_15630 [Alphaproteobacteria bacterium]|nr:hypothetical protein [Alphaproteobacteria bacterium]